MNFYFGYLFISSQIIYNKVQNQQILIQITINLEKQKNKNQNPLQAINNQNREMSNNINKEQGQKLQSLQIKICQNRRLTQVVKQKINVLFIAQLSNQQSVDVCTMAIHILQKQQIFNIYTEDTSVFANTLLYQSPQSFKNIQNKTKSSTSINVKIDYIISIGQNNTMMKAFRTEYKQLRYKNCYNSMAFLNSVSHQDQNSLTSETDNTLLIPQKQDHQFMQLASPSRLSKKSIPIISISDGHQPIMSSYSHCQLENILQNFIFGLKNKTLKLKQYMKFDIIQKNKAMTTNSFSCQFQLHRDMTKSVLRLKIYVKFDENKKFLHLTNLWGDGIIISTPVGSLGRNITLSGPIIYRNLQSLTIVPISPLSLNFRPIILPPTAQIMIQVEQNSRSPALIYADRQLIHKLNIGSNIILKKSHQTSKLIKDLSIRSNQELWINCLRQVLSWGEAYHDPEKKQRSKSNQN